MAGNAVAQRWPGRRTGLTLGVAGAALWAAAVLQAAVVFADPTDDVSLLPVGPETVTATYDPLPELYESSTGTQEFDVDEPSIAGDPTIGTVEAQVTTTAVLGVTNTHGVVVSDLTGTTGDPTAGSVYDTVVLGDTGYENVFSDFTTAGATAPSVTDSIDTPYGDYTFPVAPLALHLLGFYWHDDAALLATSATGDGLGASAADGLAGIVADLGSVF